MSKLISEIGGATTTPSNLGGKKQQLEAPVKTLVFAKDTFSFANLTALKTEATWDSGIQAKDLKPLADIEGIELANQEANIKEGRYRNYELKEGVRAVNYRVDASILTYEALKSLQDSEYTRVFEITEDEQVICDVQSDGTIKGQKLSSFIVGLRNSATDEDVPHVMLNLKFESDTFSITSPGFDVSEKEGIFDVDIEQVSASATEIKFKVKDRFSGSYVTNLTTGDFVTTDGTSAQSPSFTAADSDGVYTLTDTGITNSWTVGLNGVVSQGNLYEHNEVLTVSGI